MNTSKTRFTGLSGSEGQVFLPSDLKGAQAILRAKTQSLSAKRGIMPADKVSFYNRIDIGIFICYMDICLEHRGIGFEKKLYPDDGEDKEFVLNAVYRLAELLYDL